MAPTNTLTKKTSPFRYGFAMFGTSLPINMFKSFAAIFYVDMLGLDMKKYSKFSMACYIGMGWAIIPLAGILLQLMGGIEECGGFVHEDEGSLLCERLGEHDALAFAVGERPHPTLAQMLNTCKGNGVTDVLAVGFGEASRQSCVGQSAECYHLPGIELLRLYFLRQYNGNLSGAFAS